MEPTFFATNSDSLVIRGAKANNPGLRRSQLGAIHAISSHFTLHNGSSVMVVMPTGTGKTAVLTMVPFILSAKKVLVLSSSKMVRGQIVDEFKTLKDLRRLNLYASTEVPNVFEKQSRLTKEDVEAINTADVIIGIPKSIDILFEEEIECENDFFDLILVDEAHHLPAKTWSKTLARFPNANKVLFTATPFRRDKKLIKGKIIYNYPLSKAKEDGSFAKIEFHPAISEKNKVDEAIAKKAEEIFLQDRSNGLNHYLMARTNTTAHAEKLIDLYTKKTSLKLVMVSSKNTFRTAKIIINKLKKGELDGIVCVDMLGEGFDFPNLKIAAVHSPHKSEAITLQFIGRFTRTNAKDIGDAKFIATPNDIMLGKHQLYQEGAAWQDLIVDLSETAVGEQVEEQEIVSTFDELISADGSDVTLYNLSPYSHVKIYKIEDVDLEREIDFGRQNILNKFHSKEHSLLVIVSWEDTQPKWVSSEKIFDRKYFLYVVHYDEKKQLLFINSTLKTEDTYEEIFQGLAAKEEPSWKFQIQKEQINKVLLDLSKPDFFSVGMLNRNPGNGESYKTLTGSSTQKSIKKIDGVLYENGHMFCGAVENGKKVTVGYSSASKVWSNSYKNISEFLKWCEVVGIKISSSRVVDTGSGFDYLPIGKTIDTLPDKIISAHWGHIVYIDFPTLVIDGDELQLVDFEFQIKGYANKNKNLKLELINDDLNIQLTFSIENGFQIEGQEAYPLDTGSTLESFLNSGAVTLKTAELHTLIGRSLTEWKFENIFENNQMISLDWTQYGTDIEVEFGTQNSVQDSLEKYLMKEKNDILACDHGAGESADFIAVKEENNFVHLKFYHVKASGSAKPGDRLEDLYEVCGQVVKASSFSTDRSSLVRKITSRLSTKPQKFRIGDFGKLSGLIGGSKQLKITMVIVQPGISKKQISNKLSTLLSSADFYLRGLGVFEPVEVICSD